MCAYKCQIHRFMSSYLRWETEELWPSQIPRDAVDICTVHAYVHICFRCLQLAFLSNTLHRGLISGVILAALPSPTPPGLWVVNKYLPALRWTGLTLGSPDQPLQQVEISVSLPLFFWEKSSLTWFLTRFSDPLSGRIALASRSSSLLLFACRRAAWGNNLRLKLH